MKTYCKTLIVAFLLPALCLAGATDPKGWKGKYTKEKKIKKEFDVSASATLKINNDYGNLDLTTWDENRIVIEVIIKTNGNDEEDVKEKLNEISVNFEGSQSFVSARTQFEKSKNKSWWSSWTGGGNNNVNMEINYIVKLPATNAVDLENDYGGISINRLEGDAKIDCDYGKITIGELLSNNNFISFDYTTGCTFDYIKSAQIDADYSEYTIEKAENLVIDTDYTKNNIGEADNIQYNSDYGSLSVDKITNIQGDGDYFGLRIGEVNGNVDISADYGDISIKRLTEKAGNVNLNGDYTGIKIGYAANYDFKFDVDLSYASFSGTEGLEFTTKDVDSYSKKYKGYNGSAVTTNSLRINSDYGSVKMNRL